MKKLLLVLSGSVSFSFSLFSQNNWEVTSYKDESGYIRRTCNTIDQLSERGFGKVSLAQSNCPDTGLPVYTLALEGEEIISPYTGRRYKQGPTGYFGPKARNDKGEITAFGGDPLKYDLDPAMATLLKKPMDEKALAFVSIPGNMIQQYHFGATNWARFYGLLHIQMDEKWKSRFQEIVGAYSELRRPSDGAREHAPLSRAYNLVGFPEEKEGVLGGGFVDGGTENHKMMWRTSALVYAELFPENAKISGYSITDVKRLVPEMFTAFFNKVLQVGNGEYDSHIYYPHSIYGLLNLYDFSVTAEYREMAKFMLDYELATYGLKMVDNTIAGAQKRGYLSGRQPSEMETLTWAYTGQGSKDMSDAKIHLHQATSTYRPNRVISNIVSNKVNMPYQAFMTRPAYHMNIKNAFQESFFRSQSYGLGNVAMTMVDNPNQQVVWSLVAEGTNGPLCFGGQQPYRLAPAGHSQYSQTAHSKRTLVLISGNSAAKPQRMLSQEEMSRYSNTPDKLSMLSLPQIRTKEILREYFSKARLAAASWLYIPKAVNTIIEKNGKIFIEANNTFMVVFPLAGYEWIKSADWNMDEKADVAEIHDYLNDYYILSVNGLYSGYIVDSAEKSDYQSIDKFIDTVLSEDRLSLSDFESDGSVLYKNIEGDVLTVWYQPTGLRAKYAVNNQVVNYEKWAGGAVYDSPYVKVKDGKMYISDGVEGYQITFKEGKPAYKQILNK